jgi:hypothetical protein
MCAAPPGGGAGGQRTYDYRWSRDEELWPVLTTWNAWWLWPGLFSIGDSIFTGSKAIKFPGIPSFSPERFAYIQNPNPSKFKSFKVRGWDWQTPLKESHWRGRPCLASSKGARVHKWEVMCLRYILGQKPEEPQGRVLTVMCRALSGHQKGVEELLEEGAVQLLYERNDAGHNNPILAAVGELQYEVVQYRLKEVSAA